MNEHTKDIYLYLLTRQYTANIPNRLRHLRLYLDNGFSPDRLPRPHHVFEYIPRNPKNQILIYNINEYCRE